MRWEHGWEDTLAGLGEVEAVMAETRVVVQREAASWAAARAVAAKVAATQAAPMAAGARVVVARGSVAAVRAVAGLDLEGGAKEVEEVQQAEEGLAEGGLGTAGSSRPGWSCIHSPGQCSSGHRASVQG